MNKNFRAVVAIDFGTTYSGFAYANQNNPDITVNDSWPGRLRTRLTMPKTNTVLQYDTASPDPKKWTVNCWGFPALAQEPTKKSRRQSSETNNTLPVELFKLHLADNLRNFEKPYLPNGLDYEKAISDYLSQMKPLIKEVLDKRWPGIKFTQVRFVFTVPAEWRPHTIGILQECIHKAGFTEKKQSNNNLEFITEPEAAAIYAMGKLEEHKVKAGSSFMVVDCGGAVLRGAVMYGLDKAAVATRVLTMNYGVRVYPLWRSGVDPKKRKTSDGRIYKFSCLATRGREVAPDEPCSGTYYPIYPDQNAILFSVFATPRKNSRFCDEEGMRKIGELEIEIPDIEGGTDRPVEFSLMFGELLITANARNKNSRKIYTAKFAYAKNSSYFEATE
ncbi:unnamed protein product [Rhizophagus irregularis]|uniref:Actin-like ATPase domain-containing protein n=1 Tax=Rhizophagus irregularis TaxID=588596 RepID=A0A916EGW3_9GLOM|nr:unnamed protein product [Rhizophagus irregularis]CAB5381571.1 unnamed protein product [Rhizophagus irregularis]